MIKRLLLSLLAITVLGSAGCLFHRKNKKPKESSAIAAETEKEFHQRWVNKRLSDLAAQGVTGVAAEQQAEREFHEKFPYAGPVKK